MKEVDAEILRGNLGGVPLLGRPREMQIMVAQLCVNCFPKPEPAIFTWGGMSICQKCFVPLRKEVDKMKGVHGFSVPGIEKRDYKETWGEDPITDAEVI